MERWAAKLIFHCERGPQVNEGANRTVGSETVSAAGRCDCGHLGSPAGQPLRPRPGKARGTAKRLAESVRSPGRCRLGRDFDHVSGQGCTERVVLHAFPPALEIHLCSPRTPAPDFPIPLCTGPGRHAAGKSPPNQFCNIQLRSSPPGQTR